MFFPFQHYDPGRSLLSDLVSVLSKGNITEEDLLQLPELLQEEPTKLPNKTSLTHEPENLFITPTDQPTIALKI